MTEVGLGRLIVVDCRGDQGDGQSRIRAKEKRVAEGTAKQAE